VTPGTPIHGQVDGSGDVRVWVPGINFAVPAVREGNTWTYTYQGGLSGTQTLAFAVQDGRQWSSAAHVQYRFQADGGSTDAGERATDHFPGVIRSIIRPVEDALRSVVVLVNDGVHRAPHLMGGASNDLDGNGVPDSLQGSPVSPSAGIPYGWIALVLVVSIVSGSILLLVKADTWTAYLLRRRHLRGHEAESRARLQIHETQAAQEIKLKALQAQAGLRQSLIREQAALRAKALEVQAAQARGMTKLASTRVAGILDLRRAELQAQGQAPPARGWWARLRGR
jgi:hypothetical protein